MSFSKQSIVESKNSVEEPNDDEIIIRMKADDEVRATKKSEYESNIELHLSKNYTVLVSNEDLK